MFTTDPAKLYREWEAGIEKTRQALKEYPAMARHRAGPHYWGAAPQPDEFRRNYLHRWLTYVKPQLCYSPPQVKVIAALHPEAAEELELELALQAWVIDCKLREFLYHGVLDDMQYAFGVVLISMGKVPGARPMRGVGTDRVPYPGDGDPGRIPWTVHKQRLHPGRFALDPLAQHREECRWYSHLWVRDKDDIIAEGTEAGWNLEAIEEYASDAHLDHLGRDSNGQLMEVKRNEIVGIDMWVPEYTLGDKNEWGVPASPGPKQHRFGTWFTMLVERGASVGVGAGNEYGKEHVARIQEKHGFPRRPRPYRGNPRGPYVLFGQHDVQNQVLPLGSLTATWEEIKQLNVDAMVNQGMARSYKRMIAIGTGDGKQVELIRDTNHDNVVYIPGISAEDVVTFEIGGLTDQGLAHEQWSEEALEGTLGLSELHSGAATSKNTATADILADTAAQARFSGLELGFNEGVEDLLWRVGYEVYNSNMYGAALGRGAGEELVRRGVAQLERAAGPGGAPIERPPAPIYLGGERKDAQGDEVPRLSYQSMAIRVVPGSMGRAAKATRAQEAEMRLGVVERLLPLMGMYPDFDWEEFATHLATTLEWPQLPLLLRNAPEVAEGSIALQAALGASTGGPGGPGGGKAGAGLASRAQATGSTRMPSITVAGRQPGGQPGGGAGARPGGASGSRGAGWSSGGGSSRNGR